MFALSNTQLVMLGTSLLGCVAGVVGSFAILRRRALVGDLLSHAALPGLCLAFLLLGERQFQAMLLGAFATGLVAVVAVTVVCRWTRCKTPNRKSLNVWNRWIRRSARRDAAPR